MVNVNLRNYLYTMLKNHVLNEIRNNNSAVEKNYEIVQSAPEYEDELLIKIEETRYDVSFLPSDRSFAGAETPSLSV